MILLDAIIFEWEIIHWHYDLIIEFWKIVKDRVDQSFLSLSQSWLKLLVDQLLGGNSNFYIVYHLRKID